MMIRDNSFPRK